MKGNKVEEERARWVEREKQKQTLHKMMKELEKGTGNPAYLIFSDDKYDAPALNIDHEDFSPTLSAAKSDLTRRRTNLSQRRQDNRIVPAFSHLTHTREAIARFCEGLINHTKRAGKDRAYSSVYERTLGGNSVSSSQGNFDVYLRVTFYVTLRRLGEDVLYEIFYTNDALIDWAIPIGRKGGALIYEVRMLAVNKSDPVYGVLAVDRTNDALGVGLVKRDDLAEDKALINKAASKARAHIRRQVRNLLDL